MQLFVTIYSDFNEGCLYACFLFLYLKIYLILIMLCIRYPQKGKRIHDLKQILASFTLLRIFQYREFLMADSIY